MLPFDYLWETLAREALDSKDLLFRNVQKNFCVFRRCRELTKAAADAAAANLAATRGCQNTEYLFEFRQLLLLPIFTTALSCWTY